MNFKIVTRNKDGDIVFEGTATNEQANFIFQVGVSYLLAQGAMPLLGEEAEDASNLHDQPTTTQ